MIGFDKARFFQAGQVKVLSGLLVKKNQIKRKVPTN